MFSSFAIVLAVPWLLLLAPVAASGLYTKNSPVLQVDGKSYDKLIARSNHTSIVEFYAPWCGHCQNLKPAYEKAAKKLKGLAKVAAVNCDDEDNKPFCGSMGVQGFPTLKIIRPSKKPGKPTVEDYQSARNAKAIVEVVVDKINNHVSRITDRTLDEALAEGNDTARAILFTEKGTTSALLRAVAIDFLGSVNVAQIRDKEKNAVDTFGIEDFPTLVLLPGGDKEPIVYKGELEKDAIVEFLSQIAPPNPDPAPAKSNVDKKPGKDSKKADQKASKDSSSFSAASSSHKSADASDAKTATPSETLEDDPNPTESPNPNVVDSDAQKPIEVPDIPTLPILAHGDELSKACLQPTSSLCILALLPAAPGTNGGDAAQDPTELSEPASDAVRNLAAVSHKHAERKAKLFPFYALPASNPAAAPLRELLGLASAETPSPELIAVNAKKRFWKRYEGGAFTYEAMEDWIDALRMGEGQKRELPEVLVQAVEEKRGEAEGAEGENVEFAGMNFKDQGEGKPKLYESPEGLRIELEEVLDEHDEL
ncbi:MAG: hypothetical protein M1822_005673 [Bathelium mastoideum]|nr:MAG: hypothetical protein M1822_005673 [Bathelium mastoideum]